SRNTMGTALSIYAMGPKLGRAAAYWVGAASIALTASVAHWHSALSGFASWQLVFFIIGAPGILLSLLVLTVREPPRRRAAMELSIADRPQLLPFLARYKGLFG